MRFNPPNTEFSPSKGKVWLIIGGNIEHVTGGTGTWLDIRVKDNVTGITQRIARLLAAAETQNYPLFQSGSSATGVAATTLEAFSQYCFPLVTDERKINFNGETGSYAILDILEFDA